MDNWCDILVRSCVDQINHQEKKEGKYFDLTVIALFNDEKHNIQKGKQYVFGFGKESMIKGFLHCYDKCLNITPSDDLIISFKRLSTKMMLIRQIKREIK